MVTASISLSPQPVLTILNPKPLKSHKTQSSSPFISSRLSSICTLFSSEITKHYHNPPKPHVITPSKSTQIWRISALPENFSLSEANPVENSEQIVATNGDGVSNIISVLLFLAFVGLSVLTIGVIYIAVTDYLQKRERDKFEKEEAAKTTKGKKKRTVKARAGPRGFGQKIDEVDDDDDI